MVGIVIGLSFLVLGGVLGYFACLQKSHWEATVNELELIWESINELQGVDPEKVGEP